MASEEGEDGTVTLALPPDLQDWIDERAEREGTDRETVCRRLLGAVRDASSEDAVDPPARSELEDLRATIDAQYEEFVEHVEDVRERVIQVKREADAKAPADHDHESLADADELDAVRGDLESLEDDLAGLETSVESLAGTVDDLEGRVDAGFDNYEGILDYLVEETDTLDGRTTTLANALLEGRDRRRSLASRQRRRAETEELQLAANRLGIRTAACEDCGASVDLALLTAPECPHCASAFADVAAKSSLFGSHRLVTGDPPALEGRTDGADGSADVFDDVAEGVADHARSGSGDEHGSSDPPEFDDAETESGSDDRTDANLEDGST